MPELPEVEITMRKLAPKILRRKIISFYSDWPRGLHSHYSLDKLSKDLRGRKILRLSRIGKVIFLHLSGQNSPRIAFHQRMSGRLLILDDSDFTVNAKHIRIKLGLSGSKILAFVDPRKFGIMWYGSSEHLDKYSYLQKLGPDALSLSKKYFYNALNNKRIGIKAFLLRQDILAGVGNIVADEVLWEAKINPQLKSNSLSINQKNSLFLAIKKVLKRSIALGGSSMRDWVHPDQDRGSYQDNWRAYGRAGKKCFRCGTILKRAIIAGRGTVFCVHCQK